MATQLENFLIEGLHGSNRTVNISFSDNRLILVGENGTGKSTVANLLYYTLTQQWRRLVEYKFSAITVTAGDEILRFTHDDADALSAHQRTSFGRELRVHYSPRIVHNVYRYLSEEPFLFDDPEEIAIDKMTSALQISKVAASRFLGEFRESPSGKLKKGLIQDKKRLEAWHFGQFLYLPTYRRIEQDLTSIFRGIEIEEKVREFKERFRPRDHSTYVELIEFGMEDVEKTIQSRMGQIKEDVRTGLSTLTGTYLREVIRGLQDNPEIEVLRNIDLNGFQSMFGRIDDQILPAVDKKNLQEKIDQIAHGYTLGPEDKVIAHFLSKLVSLYQSQRDKEEDVRDFVALCNQYLTGKEFIYDEIRYEVYIRQYGSRMGETQSSDKLPLKTLSSGEKQIVSLFSHIYLSGEPDFFVVIDEPELSLSVPWQQNLLPDIMKTGRCNGLVAVTHSPFIWDNEFEPYVKPLAEFMS